tara:strand:+ start:20828 stop:21112 length:285 start_codon:yes stop_codon:yes gene_type:complete
MASMASGRGKTHELPGRRSDVVLYTQYQGHNQGAAMDELLPKKIMAVDEGFYWVKYRPGSRWEPAEFDGVIWLIGDGSGYDLYVVGPRIQEPCH